MGVSGSSGSSIIEAELSVEDLERFDLAIFEAGRASAVLSTMPVELPALEIDNLDLVGSLEAGKDIVDLTDSPEELLDLECVSVFVGGADGTVDLILVLAVFCEVGGPIGVVTSAI